MRCLGYLRRLMPNQISRNSIDATILRLIVDKLATMNHELIMVIHALRTTSAS